MKSHTPLKLTVVLAALILSLSAGCKKENANISQPKSKLFNEGISKFEDGNFEEAKKIFTSVIKANPGNVEAQIKLASTNLCLNTDSKVFFNSLDSIAGIDDQYGYLRLNNDKGKKKVKDRDKAEDTAKIKNEISNFDKALKNNPGNENLLFGRACWKLILKDKDSAIEDLERAVQIKKEFWQAYFLLGKSYKTYIETNKFREIKSDYSRALFYLIKANKLRPNDKEILTELLWLCNYFELDDQAIAIYTDMLASDPGNTQALLPRAIKKAKMKDYSGAARDYEQLLKRTPGDPVYLFALGQMKVESGDLKGGIKDVKKAKLLSKDEALDIRIIEYLKRFPGQDR